MNSKSLRRLAGDHGSLHTTGLPPNYLFPPSSEGSADLTSLDVLLAGPVGTPYAGGVWLLHLDIPPTYPTAPPTAHFRTRLWHPNVDEATGAVCVETLKRDWSSTLSLRDVLMTISCLLIQPNPESALNEAAGKLASEDWDTYCRRARLMTEIHARVPGNIADKVRQAQVRGEDTVTGSDLADSHTEAHNMNMEHVQIASSTSRLGKMATEDEENTKCRGREREPETNPDTDWIPGPLDVSTAPILQRESNIFGIKGLNNTMQVDPSSKRIVSYTPPAGVTGLENVGETDPFIVVSKRRVEMNHSLNLRSLRSQNCVTQANSLLDVPDTTEQLGASQQNLTPAIQPSDQSHTLLREFSIPWGAPWEDTDVVWTVLMAEDEMSRPCIAKRFGSNGFKAKQEWEIKRFKDAGYDIARYNRGDLGPRIGVHRL